MFLDYYKLAEQPFGVTPDSRFLYLGPTHREALASLTYGTQSNRGFLALIAKPGMGKTSLLYRYLSELGDKARTAFVFRTDCDSREFVRHVLLDLGMDMSGLDLPAMHDALNRLLMGEMRAGRRFVLVIDEAQNLEEKVLESIRLLSNFETPWMKLMQIVLAGQPQLADRLASPSMAQLRQRVSMIIRIEPFTAHEVDVYINHRLGAAGCEHPSLFTVGARKLIAENSEGIPRNINNLCFNAMSLGCALKRKTIDRDVVLEVIADLDLEPLREKKAVLKNPAQGSAQRSSGFSVLTKKRANFNDGIPRVATIGALLLALGLFFIPLNRKGSGSASIPDGTATLAAAPLSVSLEPGETAQSAKRESQPAPDVILVQPGQTLCQISFDELGGCNGKVLQELQELNPWLSDPDHIRPGQKLRIPSAPALSTDAHRATEQPSDVVPAEAGKQ
jgi:type II secretory pathway predicted ATPase ExeA